MIMKEKKKQHSPAEDPVRKLRRVAISHESITSSLVEEPVMLQGLKGPDIEAAPRPGRAGICYF